MKISAKDDEIVEVNIESGRIRGKQNVTLYNKMAYYSFRGIPYAQPPINEHRFRVSITILSVFFFSSLLFFVSFRMN